MSKTSIAVVGASGYVGEALAEELEKNKDFQVTLVIRSNYEARKSKTYDIVINAAMPSKRFWAKNHPELDFAETVEKTKNILKDWHFKKVVHISTVSARTETDSVYGKHKAEAEKLCDPKRDLIIRLSSMFSENLSKGALVDIRNNAKVFVSGQSRYPFASLDFVVQWISKNLHRTGLIEVGAKNSLTLAEIAQKLGKTIEFEGPVEDQSLQKPESDFPDASEVFNFFKNSKQTSSTHNKSQTAR